VLARAKEKAKIVAARTDMSSIASAVGSYQTTYTLAPTPKPLPNNADLSIDYSFSETNSDVIAILMDFDGLANANHARNPQKHSFLNAKLKPGKQSGAISSDDYNYRDPWGNPYIIAFDLDYDNKVWIPDGRDRIFPQYPIPPRGNPPVGIPGSVLDWSMGPDGKAENRAGNGSDREGVNKDNIRSWE
jgi:hypothetical protein